MTSLCEFLPILEDPRALAVCCRTIGTGDGHQYSTLRVSGAPRGATGRLRGGFCGRGASWPLEVGVDA